MKRKIVSILLILSMFTVLVVYGDNIDDQYDVTSIEIEDLLDSKYFDDEEFKFDDIYFSSENGIRNVVTYAYNGVLKDENIRVKLQFSMTLNKEATQALLDGHFEELDNVITGTGRRRDPDSYLELIYPDHIIKKDNQSALSYNYHKMKALWYPGSGGVAPLLNNVIYMTPEQVEETSKKLGFDFKSGDSDVSEGDSGEDPLGPFIYGQTYSIASATCEMTYAAMVNDTTYFEIELIGRDAMRFEKDYVFREEITVMSNELIKAVEEKILSLSEEITKNSGEMTLSNPSGILRGRTGLENAYVILYLNENDIYDAVCDLDGNFIIDTGLSYEEFMEKADDPILRLHFEYFNEDMKIFEITYKGDVITIDKPLQFSDSRSMNIEFFSGDISEYKTFPDNLSNHDLLNLVFIDDHMSEIYRFYRDKIGVSIHERKTIASPFKVEVFVDDEVSARAYYSSQTQNIYIKASYMDFINANRPKNREWHEYNHFVMDMMTGMPIGMSIEEILERELSDKEFLHINHMGYLNTTTADSYSEGFAEFMSLVASDMYGDNNAHVYAGFGSLEVNFKAYGDLGRDEELAVAGILWDVYDNDDTYENGNDDDTISMPIDQLMNILFTPYQNFTEVYEAFLEYYKDKPNDLKGINEIFLSHGFFIETTEGNKTRDNFEPYLDGSNKKTKDKSYTEGEYFVDYPANNVFSHDEKEVIGTPSTYDRTDRKTAVTLPGHLMHMEGNQETFSITVGFEAYPHLNFTIETKKDENAMIQLPVPPEDYDSVITISGQTGDLYQFTTADFYNRLDASVEQGYFDSIQCPDIYLEDTATEVVLVHIDNESAMPHYESRAAALEKGISERDFLNEVTDFSVEDNNTKDDENIDTNTNPSSDEESLKIDPLFIALIAIAILLLILIIFKKRK